MTIRRLGATLLPLILATRVTAAEPWQPAAWAGANTVELRTTAPGEAPHWFPVWVVVVDGQLYARLGSRAASRIERNQTAPSVGIRILGQEFDRVRGVPAPESAERVAAAMAAKYWSDVVVRHFSHPLTLRLVPETEAMPGS
jgi:hypothetical protein